MSKKRRVKDFLNDIKEAIEMIITYTKGLTYDKFIQDRKTRDAVVRNIEIIGEAAKNVSADLKEKYLQIPWRKLAGLRDKLIHHYFGIDYKVVWKVKKELPKFTSEIEEILNIEE